MAAAASEPGPASSSSIEEHPVADLPRRAGGRALATVPLLALLLLTRVPRVAALTAAVGISALVGLLTLVEGWARRAPRSALRDLRFALAAGALLAPARRPANLVHADLPARVAQGANQRRPWKPTRAETAAHSRPKGG